MACGVSDVFDRAIENCLVCLGRFRESAQLPNELERRSANFICRRGWSEVMKCFDGPAHIRTSIILDQRSTTSCLGDDEDENKFPACWCWLSDARRHESGSDGECS